MSPQVTAAIIAAGVGVITVIATVVTQYLGRRATSRDTQKALEAQRVQLDRTLAEQRTRTLNERFATAAEQLGGDKQPAVRLAGVYAMAGLADDWPENRQTCVDVLCAYLRMPYESDPGQDAPEPKRLAFRASCEVRDTVVRVITLHLKDGAAVSWQGLNFDFTGAVFDGSDFEGTKFSGGTVLFNGAEFSGDVSFYEASFSGSKVSFNGARFTGSTVSFNNAEFSGGKVSFYEASFSGGWVGFSQARFSGGWVGFGSSRFSGGTVSFNNAEFSGGEVRFSRARFTGGTVDFRHAKFSGSTVLFGGTVFTGSTVSFNGAEFSGGEVSFSRAVVSIGIFTFDGDEAAKFSGSTVDFSSPGDWSVPPAFPWKDTPPPGVKLPEKEDQSQGVGDA